jgi:hypothetical protein
MQRRAVAADRAGRPSPGVFVTLDTLVVQRIDHPTALEEAPLAIRRIGWVGRPILLVGPRVAGRSLPDSTAEREAWVRATVGDGAYAVLPFDEPSETRIASQDGGGVEAWRAIREAHHGTWLVTHRPRQVGDARQAGLKVIVIGASDATPSMHRPDYQARDLRDAVGHLLTVDVFAGHPNEIARDA